MEATLEPAKKEMVLSQDSAPALLARPLAIYLPGCIGDVDGHVADLVASLIGAGHLIYTAKGDADFLDATDRDALDRCDIFLIPLPTGPAGNIRLGYAIATAKKVLGYTPILRISVNSVIHKCVDAMTHNPVEAISIVQEWARTPAKPLRTRPDEYEAMEKINQMDSNGTA